MSVNPYEPPQTDIAPVESTGAPVSYRREKFRVLLGMLAMFALWGFIETAANPPLEVGFALNFVLNLVVSIAFGVLILRWCHYDRLELNQRRWRFFAPMMIALPGPMIMVPIYLLRSRGLAGIVSVFFALLFLILLIAANALAAYLGLASRGDLFLHDSYFTLSWP